MISRKRLKEKMRAYRKVFGQNWDLFKASKIGIVGIIIVLFFVGMAVIAPFLNLRDPINWRAPDADIIHVTSWWDIGRNVSAPQWNAGDPINHTISFRVKLAGGGATEVDRLYTTSGNKLFSLTPYGGGSYWDDSDITDTFTNYEFPHITDFPFSTEVVVSNFGDQYDPDYGDFIFGVGTYDGYVYIVEDYTESNPDQKPHYPTGDRVYYDDLGSRIVSSAVFTDKLRGRHPIEMFYFGTADGHLYAYSVTKLDNEDWTYDPVGMTWNEQLLVEGEIRPSPRTNFSMVYDSINDRIILFGGYDGYLNDETWTYDLSTRVWTRIDTEPHPSARYGHSMVFDSSSGKVVLFGGIVDGYQMTPSGETWTFDVSTDTWSFVDDPNPPSARAFSALSYDSDNDLVVLFGGDHGSSETWTYAGSGGWTERTPVTPPTGRFGHAMAYDSANGRTVMFGGNTTSPETWVYDSNPGIHSWFQQNFSATPSSRKFHSMVFDSSSGLILMYGGDSDWNETWTYDLVGDTWSEVLTTPSPSGRYGHSMIFDSNRNEVHLFGGDDHTVSRVWYRQLTDEHPIVMYGFPLNTAPDPNRSPALNEKGSLIFVNDGGVRAVNTDNGTDAWNPASVPMGGNLTNPPVCGLPSVIGPDYVEAVYATTNDGWIYAFYSSNGSALAQWEALGGVNEDTGVRGGIRVKINAIDLDGGALTIPDIRDDAIYFGSSSGHLYAIRRDTTEELPAGSAIWVYSDRKLLEEGMHFTGGVRFSGLSNLLFAVGYTDALTPKNPNDDMAYLLVIGPDGDLSWRKAIEGYIGGTPVIHKDNVGAHPTPTVWFGTSFGVVNALSSTGENMAPLPPGCYPSGNCYTLGTDAQGRDIFSQLMWGSQIALTVGLLAAAGSIGIGTIIGLVSGYSGGRIDSILMRFTDVILVLPGLPFLIILAAVLGPSYWNIIFVLTIIGWPGTARVIRSEVLSLKERPFIDSARVTGASNVRIMFKHLAPNVMPLAFLYMTLAVSGSILSEAALSFLGLGDVNTPSWGQMLQAVQTENVLAAWWWLVPPGLAITFISLAFYLIGRAFEQIVNPRLRKR